MKNTLRYTALATNVIAVASINHTEKGDLFDWAAYIGAVLGMNHEYEYKEVAKHGAKLSPIIAVAMFPDMDIKKYRT